MKNIRYFQGRRSSLSICEIHWTEIVNSSRNAEVISVYEMESNEEVWADWLIQENEIAVNDRKALGTGGGKYLNFTAFVLRKK
ncbi:hypothetical protein [Sporomusa ovata]|nr:hypothetical protein [Sporomusa ovata]